MNEKKATLVWKVQELEKLGLESGEWEMLSIDHKKLGLLAFQQAYQNNWLKADSFILQEGLKFPKNLYPVSSYPEFVPIKNANNSF